MNSILVLIQSGAPKIYQMDCGILKYVLVGEIVGKIALIANHNIVELKIIMGITGLVYLFQLVENSDA